MSTENIYSPPATRMPDDLGKCLSRLLKDALYYSLKWRTMKQLYGDSNTLALLNRCNSRFFAITRDAYFSDVIQGLCRLTDPARSSGNKAKVSSGHYNFSFRYLQELAASDAVLQRRLETKLKLLEGKMEPLKEWRNKYIAHNDLKRTAEDLPKLSIKRIDGAFKVIFDICHLVEKRYGETLSSIDSLGDGGGAWMLTILEEWQARYNPVPVTGDNLTE